jgi:hypothetical protein
MSAIGGDNSLRVLSILTHCGHSSGLWNRRRSVLSVGQGTETVIVRALLGIGGASQYCDLNQCITSGPLWAMEGVQLVVVS